MTDPFSQIPDVYKLSVEKISSYPSGENRKPYVEKCKRFIELLGNCERVIWVGTGRQEEMANFATMLTKANDKQTFCSSDTSIPYKYNSNDLVVALSSSGETERTVHYAESAFRPISKSTPVVAITTNPDSTLANIAENTGGLVVKIPGKSKVDRTGYRERQFLGDHEPLTLGGTLGELYTLEFIVDSIGSAVSGTPVLEYHNKFWGEVGNYDPNPKQFKDLYEVLPQPVSYSSGSDRIFPNKTIIAGLGLSGVVARAFSIRLSHCAGEEEDRLVNFYKDAGNIAARNGDLALIFSGSGQEFWTNVLKPVDETGASIFAVTSFRNSPLGEMADGCIEVPGRRRFRDRSKLEHPPRDPMNALFEIRAFFAMEVFIHCLVEGEEISLKAVEDKHSQLT